MKSAWIAVVLALIAASRLKAMEPVAEFVKPPAPSYLVLPPASRDGSMIPSHAPRYSYGWFGVQPRKSWYRHFGYYRDYTQWKWK
jgi:hypothetical protein